MLKVSIIVGIAAVLALWWWCVSRSARGRLMTPFWLGLSAAAGALLFLSAGLFGYRLSRHQQFLHGAWSGQVIWWEVWVGAAFAVAAAVMLALASRFHQIRFPKRDA